MVEAFLESVRQLLNDLGATVVLPIFIFVIALVLGTKPGRAFRAGVTIGIAFVGINLVIGLLWTSLTGVAQAIVTNTGVELDVVDVGWPSAAAIAFGSSVGLWVIPLALFINVLMLWSGLTRTLNVDVWNFWHFAFVGSLVVAATGNLMYGLIAAAILAVITLLFADWTAKAVQQFYNLPGISIPHAFSAAYVPIAIPLNKLLDKIPWINKLDADPEAIKKRFGVFGEPVVLGVVIGSVLGLIGFWGSGSGQEVAVQVLKTGINLGAVMLLLPRMVQILMEGLVPISEAARDFMAKRAKGREIYIGLDSAILIGHPAAIASSLLLVPIAILLMVILPGNRVLLFADLAVIPFLVAMFAPLTRGNVVRMVVIGTVSLIIGFYVATGIAPLFTDAAVAANFDVPADAALVTSIADGFSWLAGLFVAAVQLAGGLGLALLALLAALGLWMYRRNRSGWERAAGADLPEPAAVTAGG